VLEAEILTAVRLMCSSISCVAAVDAATDTRASRLPSPLALPAVPTVPPVAEREKRERGEVGPWARLRPHSRPPLASAPHPSAAAASAPAHRLCPHLPRPSSSPAAHQALATSFVHPERKRERGREGERKNTDWWAPLVFICFLLTVSPRMCHVG
jgi:hypothetical protein